MDRFETQAAGLLGMHRKPVEELLGDGEDHGTMSVRDLAAALRETDARAREDCAGIAEREGSDPPVFSDSYLAGWDAASEVIASAIRQGAGECRGGDDA